MNPPFIGMTHPIVTDWSVAMVLGLAGCFAIALIQEAVLFVQKWRRP